jgi:hypothetical protein
VKRRDFIALIGGAAAWPLAARAQQAAMPIVGLVSIRSADVSARNVAAFRKGLNETGTIEGQDVMVAYHWLDGQYDRLPAVMADLVGRRVAVIATPARWGPGGQSCHHNDPDRFRRRRRPGQTWSGHQPCPAGRQRDRNPLRLTRGDGEAAGTFP